MRSFVLAVVCLAVAAARAEQIDIDWSKVRPVEEFDHYWARLPPEMQAYRNETSTDRITNGQEALPGQFPYQVALLSDFPEGTALCGASVLTRNFLLTAAHCISGTGNALSSGGIAIMGAQNRMIVELSQQRIRFSTSGIRRHPGYDATSLRNDVALVLLNSRITYTSRVQPIRLPARTDTRQFGGFTGTVSGFGRTTDSSQATSATLRFTSNPVLTNAECITSWGFALAQSQNVCLKASGGRSACNGDSGGPLTVDSNGVLQIGVVSFVSAAGCASGRPSVYARVTYFLPWINANTW
uniref:Peptidase S1 domain-containing protein n=1 Tax=Anopheles coluzzii TaxID=1518534 RepID=A0A6E8VMT8_ANOCL|nr:brachyurin-like [Anopheles coluzzii]